MDSDITMVITSCNRHDLLRQTLDSFVACTDIPPLETIVVEDSSTPRPDWLTDHNYPRLGKIVWLQNDCRMGQLYSIDRAYTGVKTDYIFHCEDDWLFMAGGAAFMEESKLILEKYPDVVIVMLRGSILVKDPRFPFLILEPNWGGGWNGFSFNPGLRRLYDYKKIGGSYKKFTSQGGPDHYELKLSKMHSAMGCVIADLGHAYVMHIGGNRHVLP